MAIRYALCLARSARYVLAALAAVGVKIAIN
jgi:hypothetical protein